MSAEANGSTHSKESANDNMVAVVAIEQFNSPYTRSLRHYLDINLQFTLKRWRASLGTQEKLITVINYWWTLPSQPETDLPELISTCRL